MVVLLFNRGRLFFRSGLLPYREPRAGVVGDGYTIDDLPH